MALAFDAEFLCCRCLQSINCDSCERRFQIRWKLDGSEAAKFHADESAAISNDTASLEDDLPSAPPFRCGNCSSLKQASSVMPNSSEADGKVDADDEVSSKIIPKARHAGRQSHS